MSEQRQYDFSIPMLGTPRIASPISYSTIEGDCIANYVRDEGGILYDIEARTDDEQGARRDVGILQKAGPRETIYFNPSHTHAGIVTCGGLCPGLNDVISAVTRCLWYRYRVRRITGIRFGYQGFLAENQITPMELTPGRVADIHKIGGSILGTSRGGGERTGEIVDAIEQMNLNILFVIGGDGTQKGALAICKEIEQRRLKVAVIGIPKTIDNDLRFVQRSFGFETAVAMAVDVVRSARAEAFSVRNGVGLVKVMGRDSGFIAAHTAIASHEVDLALVPEVPFELESDNGLFSYVERFIENEGHIVIVVAEGAAQHLVADDAGAVDASGNRLQGDIGLFLKRKIADWFIARANPIYMKYIDPSYTIRSAVATPNDALYCFRLGNNAVHAAMAGKTGILIGLVNNTFVHLPIALTVEVRNKIDPESSLWRDVIEATHQPLTLTSGSACLVNRQS